MSISKHLFDNHYQHVAEVYVMMSSKVLERQGLFSAPAEFGKEIWESI